MVLERENLQYAILEEGFKDVFEVSSNLLSKEIIIFLLFIIIKFYIIYI